MRRPSMAAKSLTSMASKPSLSPDATGQKGSESHRDEMALVHINAQQQDQDTVHAHTDGRGARWQGKQRMLMSRNMGSHLERVRSAPSGSSRPSHGTQ